MRRRKPLPPDARQRGFSLDARQRGFSMIEGLIATALIGVVAIGLIPMFTRSMSDNMAGSDYTRVSNYARSRQEDFGREPFSNYTAAVATGQTSSQVLEYLDPKSLQWLPGPVPASSPGKPEIVWTRTTTYTQYDAKGADADGVFDYPLAGGSSPETVQLIQATVQVQSISAIGPEGGHKTAIMRFLKGF
jgi:prepilin-type N-terminal cleavage/methylation domain-containing protein